MTEWQSHRSTTAPRLAALSARELDRLDETEQRLEDRRSELLERRDERKAWLHEHREIRWRLQAIDAGLEEALRSADIRAATSPAPA